MATPNALWADKEYHVYVCRPMTRGILPIIPALLNREALEHRNFCRYRDHNQIERVFGKLKQQCGIANRHDETMLSFASFVKFAATGLWPKSFVNTAS